MKEKDIIVIELFTAKTVFYFLQNLNKKKQTYYINSSGIGKILIKILNKLNLAPKKIIWDNNDIKDKNETKIFTKVKKTERFEFLSDILNNVLQNFSDTQKVDKFFMIYLSLILPNLKIINKKYLPQQILVSISALDKIFSDRLNLS